MKIIIEYQNQFGGWLRYTEKHNEKDAYRTARDRAIRTGKRHRLVSSDGQLLDMVLP